MYFTCDQLYWGKQSRLKGDREWGWGGSLLFYKEGQQSLIHGKLQQITNGREESH